MGMKTMLQEWKDAIIGTSGCIATFTLKNWSELWSGVAGLLTALYMGHKCWKEIIKPWLKKKGLL